MSNEISISEKLTKEIDFSSEKASGMTKKLLSLIMAELGGFLALLPIFLFSMARSIFDQYTFVFLEEWAEKFQEMGSPYQKLVTYGIIFFLRKKIL